jgi:hypothetical protein
MTRVAASIVQSQRHFGMAGRPSTAAQDEAATEMAAAAASTTTEVKSSHRRKPARRPLPGPPTLSVNWLGRNGYKAGSAVILTQLRLTSTARRDGVEG